MPVRVCLHVLSPARTNIRALRAVTALTKAGFDVTVVDIEHEDKQPGKDGLSTKFLVTTGDEVLKQVHMQHITMPNSFARYYDPIQVIPWLLFKIWRVWYAIIAVLRTPADIYHASDLTALPACFIASVARRKPLIFEFYDMPLVSTQVTSRPLLRSFSTRLLSRMVARCSAIISPSPPLVQEMKRRYPVRQGISIRNIPSYQSPVASDRIRQALDLAPEQRIALYQGALVSDRGLDLLVRTAHYLAPNVIIAILGKGEGQSALEALIAEEGVGDKVKLLPAVPYVELLTWTASADLSLIVFPLDGSLNLRMSLPNKLFESLMVGVPVLTSPLEAIVDIVSTYDVGQVVTTVTPEMIGQTINEMLRDVERLACMRHNALIACQTVLRWDVESQKLIDLYLHILDRPSAGLAPMP